MPYLRVTSAAPPAIVIFGRDAQSARLRMVLKAPVALDCEVLMRAASHVVGRVTIFVLGRLTAVFEPT
jgi:hypothetical protein